jgi:deoxyribonuclease V
MRVKRLHSWRVSVAEARAIQERLSGLVVRAGRPGYVKLVAGTDISGADESGMARAAIVVMGYPGMDVVEVSSVIDRVSFPYVPGLLSFREIPLLARAFRKLSSQPDLVISDGQGYAHPRRFGLASHLGVLLGLPTIGCAKSRLCGVHGEIGTARGDWTELTDCGEVIGAVVRTRMNTRPVYVSNGNMIDLQSAIKWVLDCCQGFRIPEPTRLAHLAAGGRLVNLSN